MVLSDNLEKTFLLKLSFSCPKKVVTLFNNHLIDYFRSRNLNMPDNMEDIGGHFLLDNTTTLVVNGRNVAMAFNVKKTLKI